MEKWTPDKIKPTFTTSDQKVSQAIEKSMHLAVIPFLLQDLLKQLYSKSLNSSYKKILQKLDFEITWC